MVWCILTLFMALAFMWYVVIKLFIKCTKFDDVVFELQSLLTNRDDYIRSVMSGLGKIMDNLDTIKAKDLFESDDDVGILFKLMQEQITQLKGFIDNMEEDEPNKQEAKE